MKHVAALKPTSNTQLASTSNPARIPPVTRQTLDGVPARALKLLRGLGLNVPARAALEHRGFSENDSREGWELLARASGYRKVPGLMTAGQYDAGVRTAITELDAWDEDGFAIIRATLERRFPEQAAKVLDGLSASTGAAAVIGVGMLLDRLDALGASRDKTDKAALAMLAERGIGSAERNKLRAYVETAMSGASVEAKGVQTAEEAAAADAKHVEALMDLRGWYEEWSTVAKAVVKRRDQLILLGLAKQKRRDDASAAPVATPVTTPAAPVVAPVVAPVTGATPVSAVTSASGSPVVSAPTNGKAATPTQQAEASN